MFACHRFLLVTPVLAATLSGCGAWDAWVQRNHREPAQMAYHDGAADDSYHSQPAPSPSEVFNENYDPYDGDYEPYGPQLRRFAPPPAPPAWNDETTSNLNRQDSETDSAATDEQLIRPLRAPRMFSPESVRSIYDRIRGSRREQPPSKNPEPEGPIALRQNPQSSTQPRGIGETEIATTHPVRLGIPETEEGPLLKSVAADFESASLVVQACPSCYKHPMYADPMALSASHP